ncbi:hypothetical protein RvY_17434 [Ramazzottius varieornatus]|uniref:Uncharacterized protein n=1 Tax=Ramazzottius varieornatus TaxID=947166 RepID=A0A1D1W5Z8_RAMVA|nr:hypothetical protein RvY_17434 [Ramazzottius varieornatus]
MVAMDDSDSDILNDPAALSQIPAIPVDNTIAYVNQAALVMVQHMNRFSAAAEEKLYHISTSVTRLETELAILEGKLSSIPGLDGFAPKTVPDAAVKSEASQTTTTADKPLPPGSGATPMAHQPQPALSSAPTPASRDVPPKGEPATSAADDAAKSTTPTMLTVQHDPVYSKYFRMLNVGVPLQAVKLKMKSEGLNPDLLDTPNAPSQANPSIPSSAKKRGFDSESSAQSSDDD